MANRLTGGHHAELRAVRAAEDDESGTTEPVNDLARERGAVVRQEPRALGERDPLLLGHQVLHQEGDTGEGQCGAILITVDDQRPVQRSFVLLGHHGVQRRVQRLDPVDRGLHELGRGGDPPMHELRVSGGVEVGEIRRDHRPTSAAT